MVPPKLKPPVPPVLSVGTANPVPPVDVAAAGKENPPALAVVVPPKLKPPLKPNHIFCHLSRNVTVCMKTFSVFTARVQLLKTSWQRKLFADCLWMKSSNLHGRLSWMS